MEKGVVGRRRANFEGGPSPIPSVAGRGLLRKPTLGTNITELRVYIRGRRMNASKKGWLVEASSRYYYSVNANVNTAADVFRKARISPRLLILVIAATYTPDALNAREHCAAESQRGNVERGIAPGWRWKKVDRRK